MFVRKYIHIGSCCNSFPPITTHLYRLERRQSILRLVRSMGTPGLKWSIGFGWRWFAPGEQLGHGDERWVSWWGVPGWCALVKDKLYFAVDGMLMVMDRNLCRVVPKPLLSFFFKSRFKVDLWHQSRHELGDSRLCCNRKFSMQEKEALLDSAMRRLLHICDVNGSRDFQFEDNCLHGHSIFTTKNIRENVITKRQITKSSLLRQTLFSGRCFHFKNIYGWRS